MSTFRIGRNANGTPTIVPLPDNDNANGVELGASLDLPDSLRDVIADQYSLAVAKAPEHFADFQNDEDALSGSFGTVLRETVRGRHSGYEWETSAKKLRGRGGGAGEKRYGADIALEIQIRLDGKTRRKTLLIQSKKRWDEKDAKLSDQARKIVQFPGSGLVVDYRPQKYRAVRAERAVEARGDAREIPESDFRDLGDVLGGDFLACRVGSTGVYYDADEDIVVVLDNDTGALRLVELMVVRQVRTTVRRSRKRR